MNITKGIPTLNRDNSISVGEAIICQLGSAANNDVAKASNGNLILEAFEVANQTGLSPKQLLEQRDELLGTLKNITALLFAEVVSPDGANITEALETLKKAIK